MLSLLTGHRSDRFYHSVAFTRVEMLTAPAASVRQAIEADASVGLLLLQGLSSRILQTETMIETLTHRDMSSRLVSFLLVLCRDFGVPSDRGITIDLRLSHQAIAEAIGSTRVTITRLLGDLRNAGLVEIDRKKITVLDLLAKKFSWDLQVTMVTGWPELSRPLNDVDRLAADPDPACPRWCSLHPGRSSGFPRWESAPEPVGPAPPQHRCGDHSADGQS